MFQLRFKIFSFAIAISLTACSTTPTSTTPVPKVAVQEVPPTSAKTDTSVVTKPVDQSTLQPIDVGNVNVNEPLVAAKLEKNMDDDDKIKMSKALDKAPGKTTEWLNARTRIHYSVTPTKKVIINNNPFCREYSIIIIKNNFENRIAGTACIATDGNWHTL